MKYATCITLFSAITLSLSAQFTDNFQDGDLTSAPTWTGDTDSFVVSSEGLLQLNAHEGGQSSIFSRVTFPDSIEWEFDVRMLFPPSSSNRLRITLLSSSADPENMSGFGIEIGHTGSPDPVCFYAVDSGQTLILACSEGLFPSEIDHTFKITYQTDGMWTLMSKSDSGPYLKHMALNEIIKPSDFSQFGIHCTYTKSRSQHFLFDNFFIREIQPDIFPPVLLEHKLLSDTMIQLTFDEPLAQPQSNDHFSISPWREIHDVVIMDNELYITLSEPFESGVAYDIHLRKISDVHQNQIRDTLISATYWKALSPLPGELMITEVLPDPTPAIGLPPFEFVELYNRMPHAVRTDKLKIVVDGDPSPIENSIIPPYSFAILVDKSDPWPSHMAYQGINTSLSPLRNSHGTLDLTYNDTLIHSMQYSDDHYTASKSDPDGRSLELVDMENPCAVGENWQASPHLAGGTPGMTNASIGIITSPAQTPHYYFISYDRKSLEVHFDLLLSQQSNAGIEVRPEAGIESVDIDRQLVRIDFIGALLADQDYSILIEGLRDCSGTPLPLIRVECITPPIHEPKHICINEVLFDPPNGCPAFIEILNYSGFSVNSDQLAITGSFGTMPISIQRTLPPNGILVITPAPITLSAYFPNVQPEACHRHSMSAPDKNADLLILHTDRGTVLDSASYHEEMHHPALTDTRGISLERISPLLNGNDPASWQSAAELSGWATPGFENSQLLSVPESPDPFTIENDVFSPDGDGYEDEVIIHFNNNAIGSVVTAHIADQTGQLVRSLSGHILAGNSSFLVWDGSDQHGSVRPPGLYLIMIEIIGKNGRSEIFKEPVVLAGGF